MGSNGGRVVSERGRNKLIREDLFGWEAGIRTPITWFREWINHVVARRFASFPAVLPAVLSVRLLPFRCVSAQLVSLCLTQRDHWPPASAVRGWPRPIAGTPSVVVRRNDSSRTNGASTRVPIIRSISLIRCRAGALRSSAAVSRSSMLTTTHLVHYTTHSL